MNCRDETANSAPTAHSPAHPPSEQYAPPARHRTAEGDEAVATRNVQDFDDAGLEVINPWTVA